MDFPTHHGSNTHERAAARALLHAFALQQLGLHGCTNIWLGLTVDRRHVLQTSAVAAMTEELGRTVQQQNFMQATAATTTAASRKRALPTALEL